MYNPNIPFLPYGCLKEKKKCPRKEWHYLKVGAGLELSFAQVSVRVTVSQLPIACRM